MVQEPAYWKQCLKLKTGILACSVMSHCIDEVDYLSFGPSYSPNADPKVRFVKMKGRKVFEYALKYVPQAMKDCLDKTSVSIKELKKVFIHQANEKMDESIIKALLINFMVLVKCWNISIPMSIHKLGNSSVATVPTLYDMVGKEDGTSPTWTRRCCDVCFC